MQLVVVGGERTVLTFSLMGIRGVVVRGAEDLEQTLRELVREPDVGAIMLEPETAALAAKVVARARKRRELPLVVELPGEEEERGIEEVVRRAMRA